MTGSVPGAGLVLRRTAGAPPRVDDRSVVGAGRS